MIPTHSGKSRAAKCQPVDALMGFKAAVLSRDHRRTHSWTDLAKLSPTEPACLIIHPNAIQQPAIAVIEPRLAGPPILLDLRIVGQARRRAQCVERRVKYDHGDQQ